MKQCLHAEQNVPLAPADGAEMTCVPSGLMGTGGFRPGPPPVGASEVHRQVNCGKIGTCELTRKHGVSSPHIIDELLLKVWREVALHIPND
ncbi:MAG: hypothetical protein ACO3JL_21905 [Myxococcota bacterium]